MENKLRIVVAGRGNLLGCPSINILIENDETLEFLTETGDWTKNPGTGQRFESRAAAMKAAKAEAIGKFNIVWHIPALNQFVNLDHGRGKGVVEVAPA